MKTMKTKGQQPLVAKLEPLALCAFRGGVAERSNASDCKSVDGDFTVVQGSESLPRRQNRSCTPVEALTSTGAEIRTAEAVQICQAKYRAFGCESQGDSSHDVPLSRCRPHEL